MISFELIFISKLVEFLIVNSSWKLCKMILKYMNKTHLNNAIYSNFIIFYIKYIWSFNVTNQKDFNFIA